MSAQMVHHSRRVGMVGSFVGLQTLLVTLAMASLTQGGCGRVRGLFDRKLTPTEIFQEVSPSVFVVEALSDDGKPVMLGSAVASAPDVLITNCHVVRNSSSLRIRRGQQNWSARLITAIPEHDLCGLRPAGLTLLPVRLRFSSQLVIGEHVYAVGSPKGLELTFSEGVVSGLRENEGVHMIQTSAPISPGSSGGGLFDEQGQLVGITTLFLEGGQNLNFALPGEWVRAALSGSGGNDKHSSRRESDALLESKAWLAIGLDAVKAEDYDLAVHAFRQCRELHEAEASRAWFELGNIAARGISLDSQSDAFKSWFRKYEWTVGEPERRAIECFEKAIEAQPNYADAWRELGRMYFLSNYTEAVQAEQEATRLDSTDKQAWVLLGVLYWKHKSYGQAVDALQRGLLVAPNDPALLRLLGMIYANKKDRQGMLDVYDELKQVDPKQAEGYFRAYVLPQSAEGRR